MSDDDYGFVVAESGDIDAHDWCGVGWDLRLAFDSGFDVTKWNKGVVSFVWKLAKDAGLVNGKIVDRES